MDNRKKNVGSAVSNGGTVSRKKKKKKRIEFSKLLVCWAMTVTTICVAISYILAFFDHDVCSEVTVAIVTSCIAIAVSYSAKSLGEKHSRNKYGIDTNGNKIMASASDDQDALG